MKMWIWTHNEWMMEKIVGAVGRKKREKVVEEEEMKVVEVDEVKEIQEVEGRRMRWKL